MPSSLTDLLTPLLTCKAILTATATLDFGHIDPGDSEDQTITVTGAAVGDCVTIGLPAAWTDGVIYQAFVSAADTVTVRATNAGATFRDPASATFRVAVLQFS
jgi:hypothetical protein